MNIEENIAKVVLSNRRKHRLIDYLVIILIGSLLISTASLYIKLELTNEVLKKVQYEQALRSPAIEKVRKIHL